jgi:hypothetical protein
MGAVSVIGGYGTRLNTRIEDLAEEADWAARRGRGTDQAEEALQRYLCALEAITAQRTFGEGAHSVDLDSPPQTGRKSVAAVLAARSRVGVHGRRKAA